VTEKTLRTLPEANEDPPPAALLRLWQEQPAIDRAPLTVRRYNGALRRFLAWYEEEAGPLARP
jgi:hypothetical protein